MLKRCNSIISIYTISKMCFFCSITMIGVGFNAYANEYSSNFSQDDIGQIVKRHIYFATDQALQEQVRNYIEHNHRYFDYNILSKNANFKCIQTKISVRDCTTIYYETMPAFAMPSHIHRVNWVLTIKYEKKLRMFYVVNIKIISSGGIIEKQ